VSELATAAPKLCAQLSTKNIRSHVSRLLYTARIVQTDHRSETSPLRALSQATLL